MKSTNSLVATLVVCLFLAPTVWAQAPASENQSAASPAQRVSAAEVPRLIKFSGTLLDAQERPLAGPVGVTFALYSQQAGGAALWMETQNVKPDANGSYTVLLGAASANGLPTELFVSGEARWLGIQVGQQPEHERILLVSVPYAVKAGDAETLGGLPPSAFVTTGTPASTGHAGGTAQRTSTQTQTTQKGTTTPQPATPCTSVTSDGAAAVNSIAVFTTACNVQSSVITQSGANVGFGTATPAVAVDVVGNNAGLRLSGTGTHQVTVTGATSGRLGQDANGFFFASDTNGKSVRFLTNNGTLNEWLRVTSAGNIGIGTTTPAAKLDINGNLNLPTTTSATVGVISLGGTPFAHNFGPANSDNTFLGLTSGNFSMTGTNNTATGTFALRGSTSGSFNTAVGFAALSGNTTGFNNTASGTSALQANTTGVQNTANGSSALGANTIGTWNTATGYNALQLNTTGNNNTAVGVFAGQTSTLGNANTTGSNNTFIGYNSGPGTSTQLTNAAAIGANALVNCSNCMVLGDSTTSMSVGIGTDSPFGSVTLDVEAPFSNCVGVMAVLGPPSSFAACHPIFGIVTTNTDTRAGIVGQSTAGPGVAGNSSSGDGIFGSSSTGLAGDFSGDVTVSGTLSKGAGAFRIDHPLDPADKYLLHSFVESPDMMNIYNGNALMDGNGEAWVQLPEWFEVLNRDFRYQLTALGTPAPNLYIAEEISGNRFKIAGGHAGGKVSWQVTGIRHDPYAVAHPIVVEQQKPVAERGTYLHPELYGQPKEKGVDWLKLEAQLAGKKK